MHLPGTLLTGNAFQLRRLHLVNILPPLPSTTSITRFFFQISVTNVPSGTAWFAQLVGSLYTMPQLTHLTLDFGQLDSIPPKDVTQTTLLQLTEFKFVGLGDHLEALLSRFDAPALVTFCVDLLDSSLDPSMMTSFPHFTGNSAKLKSSIAFVGLTQDCIYVKTCSKYSSDHGSITLRVRHVDEDEVGESVTVVSEALKHILSTVVTLVLGFEDLDKNVTPRHSRESPEIEV
ncbi:hypothetical protein BC834DRAFT_974764 [Gloeopeniophorella convolvens]|nr:hypothetical protein BC834DRAFT_974764 [Gloeopeniophorella convolvens]